jgi:hypothetical protein
MYTKKLVKYTGFLPALSVIGPANNAPVATPNKNIDVASASAVFETWNSFLACSRANESAAEAHPVVKTSRKTCNVQKSLYCRDQFRGLFESLCENSTVIDPGEFFSLRASSSVFGDEDCVTAVCARVTRGRSM